MMIPKDLVAASSTPLLLSILERGENYGYAIIKAVKELSRQELAWTEGMLYPVLHRLEEQDFIASRWREMENGRKRKYYRLTRAGAEELARQRAAWTAVNRTLKRSWGEERSE